ncbi:hypothetical protein EDD68_107124 [Melghiribacillus thermohalophilus]|uniref:Uncharacterized protein n=1 Tax=Melghiribacillus thermohalophilus TaxID=1324956 RepID=A0A4R3N2S3_9BACI|nr:AimR family lysis-lysogeny pheromone receptor [Melghiribacillus thermohalophilus]TCT23410.1 hypothetical protein EDD68_107124 [Melghiribacillus thermohalophilus]
MKEIFIGKENLIGEQDNLYEVIQHVSKCKSKQESMEIIKFFILSSHSKQIQREGMEFLYWNGFYDELIKVVQNHKNYTDMLSRQWAEIYEFIYLQKKNRINESQLLDHLKHFVSDEPEILILKDFMCVYSYYKMKEYDMLGKYIDPISDNLMKVPSIFLRNYFNMRLNEVLFHYHWKMNELITARRYAFKVINESYNEEKKATLYSHLGQTYVFESYETTMKYLNKAYQIANDYQYPHLKNLLKHHTIPFVHAYYGKTDSIETNDRSEQAHLEIARGNHQAAMDLLDQITKITPFRLYYYGLAKKDRGLLMKAHHAFITEYKDHFYAQLPLKAIEKLNLD